jgi:ABC-2 type transport system ATP-binding protein
VILSTHLLHEVSATCDKVLIINQGRMVAFDGVEEPDSLEETFIKLTAA